METYSIVHVATVYHCFFLGALEYTEGIKEALPSNRGPRLGMVSTGGRNEIQS